MDTGRANEGFLPWVETANPDQRDTVGADRRDDVAEASELGWLRAEQGRKRHAVNVAARAGRRGVHVAMCIDPE